jgi:hypothetical protein
VEPENHKKRAEEEDLGHEGLDDAPLEAGDEGHDEEKDDEDIDYQGGPILEDRPSGPVITAVLG